MSGEFGPRLSTAFAKVARPFSRGGHHASDRSLEGRSAASVGRRPELNQDQIWSQVQEELRFQLAKRTYDMWLKNTSVVSADGSTFRIGVPSKLAKDWLEDRFSGLIQETLQAVTGSEVNIDFVIAPSGHRPAHALFDGDDNGSDNGHDSGAEAAAEASVIATSELNARFRFSSFVVGHNSQFAHAAAKAVAEAPGDSYNPLFLYGGVGLGKTHLMHAIGHEVHDNFPRKRVVYMTSEQFTNEVITSIATARMGEFRHKYRTVDVLLIDDVQFLAGKDRTKEEFFHTFNALHEINKQIVISSDRPPKEIPTRGPSPITIRVGAHSRHPAARLR